MPRAASNWEKRSEGLLLAKPPVNDLESSRHVRSRQKYVADLGKRWMRIVEASGLLSEFLRMLTSVRSTPDLSGSGVVCIDV